MKNELSLENFKLTIIIGTFFILYIFITAHRINKKVHRFSKRLTRKSVLNILKAELFIPFTVISFTTSFKNLPSEITTIMVFLASTYLLYDLSFIINLEILSDEYPKTRKNIKLISRGFKVSISVPIFIIVLMLFLGCINLLLV